MAESTSEIRQRLRREYGVGPVSDDQRDRMESARNGVYTAAEYIEHLCPNNRARSLALTKLQEAKMWAVQSIADEPPTGGG